MKKKNSCMVTIGFITAAINFGIQKNITSNKLNETFFSIIEALTKSEMIIYPFRAYDTNFQYIYQQLPGINNFLIVNFFRFKA